MRITADTNFFISATQWDYSVSNKLLIKLIEKEIEIFTTKEILEEFSEVLIRDFKYSSEETKDINTKILQIAILVEPEEKLNIIKDDPDDNKILECAAFSDSEYIITYDNHLLTLKEFRGIKIRKPEDLLKEFI